MDGTHRWAHPCHRGLGYTAAAALVLSCSAYSYFILSRAPIGFQRLVRALPVLVVFALVPWIFDPATQQNDVAVLFCICTWVSSFRLLALCFGHGPLAESWVSASFVRFHVTLALPIRLSKSSTGTTHSQDVLRGGDKGTSEPATYAPPAGVKDSEPSRQRRVGDGDDRRAVAQPLPWQLLLASATLKTALLALTTWLYLHRARLPPLALSAIYAANLFLFVTAVSEVLSAAAALLLRTHLETPFDRPYLAGSLEDFWGRRWNLIVSACLREVVYDPVLSALSPPARPLSPRGGKLEPAAPSKARAELGDVDGREGLRSRAFHTAASGAGARPSSDGEHASAHGTLPPSDTERRRRPPLWARFVAMIASFFVSGLMHELAVFYLSFKVTGEMTAFFTLHGVATALEMAAKRGMGRRVRLWRCVSVPLTLAFCFVTANWLFWAPVLRLGIVEEAVQELCVSYGIPTEL